MDARVSELEAKVKRHDELLRGNGREGILIRLSNVERAVYRNAETGQEPLPERMRKVENSITHQNWLIRIILAGVLLIASGGDIPSIIRMIFP